MAPSSVPYRWLTVVITSFLLLVIAYQSSSLLWRFFTPEPTITPPVLSFKTPTATQFASLQFRLRPNQQPNQPTEPPHQTTKPFPKEEFLAHWQLVGTYLDDHTAFAIIKTPYGSHLVEKGQSLAEGKAVLQQILSNRVILTVAGKQSELFLADHSIQALKDNLLDYSASTTKRPRPIIRKPSFKNTELTLFKALLWKPLLNGDQLAYQVVANQAAERALLQRYGLLTNDIIISINQQPLTPALIDRLAFEKKIKAKVKRNGTIQTIEINLMPQTP